MSKIQSTFQQLQGAGRKALIPFITAGDPDASLTVPLMHALVAGDGKGRSKRRADISRAVSRGDALPAIDAVRALVAPARDAAAARVARKQQRLESVDVGPRER